MTDRELLEAAAKAAGIAARWNENPPSTVQIDDFGDAGWWNPLDDDGDALRLAVKLGMQIWRNTGGTVSAMPPGDAINFWERLKDELTPDPYAATRRAIVRAAAEIGKAMQ
ncbi:hypothetical protein [Acidovorax sp.]|uniref:hypothetical protein n=1 Tax=Acidovorax sp. TaxID=1872122 RepID=UPI00391DC04E